MLNIKQFLAALPRLPGVYQMLDKTGKVIYVGKAKDLKNRLSSYFSGQVKDPKTTSLVQAVDDITITVTQTENEAILLECTLIKKQLPKYNILLRDDKSFPYIALSDHPFPRLEFYRGTRKKKGRLFGPYPDSRTVRETISLLQKLFRLRTCTDAYFHTRKRPCLLYQLQRCTAPCVGHIADADYEIAVNFAALFLEGKNDMVIDALIARMEQESALLHYEKAAHYRDQINRLRQLQDKKSLFESAYSADVLGIAQKAGVVAIQVLTLRHGQLIGSTSYFPRLPFYWTLQDVLEAFITQHYLEHASQANFMPSELIIPFHIDNQLTIQEVLAAVGNKTVKIHTAKQGIKKQWLLSAVQNAEESLALYLSTKTNTLARFKALETALSLKKMPERVECFDISHTHGDATVGACVVFDHAGPKKEDYRLYNIRGLVRGDDLAAMREVLQRRYKNQAGSHEKQPDLIIVDGGKQQLHLAQAVFTELEMTTIPLIGVSKGIGRKPGLEMIHQVNKPPYRLPVHSLALHLIQHIRDEAHRFAITGHRKKREKESIKSILETIPGIGAKRRRDLLRYFGGIQGLAHASLDRLMAVPGIDFVLAERIFTALNNATI
jgi:excinuclease ABC subunit C